MNKTFRKVMGLDKKVSGMSLEKDFEFDATAVARARKEGKRCFFDLIVLDESGSMCSIYKQALDGVNETLSTIRQSQTEDDTQRHFVSLVAFDSSHTGSKYRHIRSRLRTRTRRYRHSLDLSM